jgi:type IV pilus assembly protein PilW
MKQTRTAPLPRSCSGQRGFSMIELTVAIVVAVFLLAGLFTILQATQDTSTQQTALTQLQDNERYAMSLFTNMVESAGFFETLEPDGVTVQTNTLALPVDGAIVAGQGIYGGSNGTGNDTLITRFQTNPGDGVSSCLGKTNTNAGTTFSQEIVYKNTLQVATTASADVPKYSLTCSDGNGVTAIPLVTGVQSMTILWGVNTSAATTNASCPADTYFTTAQMVAAASSQYWSSVCTVQVTLTFTNPMYQTIPGAPPTPGQPATVKFTKIITVMGKAGPAIT